MALYPFKDFVQTLADGITKSLRISGYDPDEDNLKMKSVQKKWRDAFTNPTNALNTTDKWDLVQTGTGMTVSVVNGELQITSGTTISQETILMSKETFTDPFRALFAVKMSQKIANTDFIVEAVSVDPTTGLPDGLDAVQWRLSGSDTTTTTNGVYVTQNGGLTALASGNSTIQAVTAYNVLELELFSDEVWWHSRIMDSANGRSNSYVRQQQIPNPDGLFKIRVRVLNRATAPASSTTCYIQYVTVIDYAELTAEITAGRGNVVAGQGMYATVGGTVTASNITGNVAHDSGSSGNPVRIGAKAINVVPTAVSATNDVTDVYATMAGALIVREHCIPEASWSFACTTPVNNTTDLVLKTAGASGVRNYINGFQLQNSNTVATEVVIKDGATVIWRGYLPASMTMPVNISFDQPLRGSSATAVNFACITTGASVYINAQGYQAP
jgi:hypothetical protein